MYSKCSLMTGTPSENTIEGTHTNLHGVDYTTHRRTHGLWLTEMSLSNTSLSISGLLHAQYACLEGHNETHFLKN